MFRTERIIDDINGAEGWPIYQKYCGCLTLEQLFTTDLMYVTAQQCASGFRGRSDTERFFRDPWGNSQRLAQSVREGEFVPKYYGKKKIMERGKVRIIRPPAFECKSVQKLLCSWMIRPLIEARCTQTNYAALKGRGTSAMHERIESDLNRVLDQFGKSGRIVLCDYMGYFDSIYLPILFGMLGRYIADSRIIRLMRLFYDGDQGLTLGDELSQLPASWFPSFIDHYIAEGLGIPYRYRYMDDALFLAESQEQAETYISEVKKRSAEHCLTLKDKKTKIIPFGKSFRFCHELYIFRNGHYHREINPSSVKREKQKIRYAGKEIAEAADEKKKAEIIAKWNSQTKSWLGTVYAHPNTRLVQKEILTLAKDAGLNPLNGRTPDMIFGTKRKG